MKLVQFEHKNERKLGVKTDQGILDVSKAAASLNMDTFTNMKQLFSAGNEGIQSLRTLLKAASKTAALFVDEDDIVYQPVVDNPEKIVCVGLNYQSHIKESNMDIPSKPVLFSKFNNTLASHQQTITLPSFAKEYDYEAELVVIIGKEAKNVEKEDALSYVFGYSVGNDLSARDLQLQSGQWLIGKSLDQFGPIGPYLVTPEAIDSTNLAIECRVNGEIRQLSNTKHMIFDCATLISYISKHMTLKPGDIIFTGTPEGVIFGNPEEERVWLQSGDEVEVFIEHIGTLTNKLI